MSDVRPLLHPGIVGLLVGIAGALAMAVRIVELDEAASDRARIVILLAFIGAGTTAFLGALVVHLIAGRWPGWLRGIIALPLIAAGFAGTMALAFAVHNRLVEGHIDEEALTGIRVRTIIWSHIGAVGMFTPTGRNYLFPWPVPAVALAGAAALAIGRRARPVSTRSPPR